MHDAIYDILVSECGAKEAQRASFRLFDLEQPNADGFRFGPQLGLSGVFAIDPEGVWVVTCTPRDRTPRRAGMIDRANAALGELQGA